MCSRIGMFSFAFLSITQLWFVKILRPIVPEIRLHPEVYVNSNCDLICEFCRQCDLNSAHIHSFTFDIDSWPIYFNWNRIWFPKLPEYIGTKISCRYKYWIETVKQTDANTHKHIRMIPPNQRLCILSNAHSKFAYQFKIRSTIFSLWSIRGDTVFFSHLCIT